MADHSTYQQTSQRVFGLIGYPLSHSFSKKYFTEKFAREGRENHFYEAFSIPSIELLPEVLKTPGLMGLNVTIPYKEQVLAYLDVMDERVRQIGACNCVHIKEGKLIGYNTDALGFETSLKEQLQPHHDKALIFGTGGAAKAVRFVLDHLGIAYVHVSRKPSFNSLSYEQITPELLAGYPLLINTTPLGMYPNTTEAVPIPYDAITERHYLYDLVYNPATTLFLQKGKEKGASIKNGYDMLVLQSEQSWRIWMTK